MIDSLMLPSFFLIVLRGFLTSLRFVFDDCGKRSDVVAKEPSQSLYLSENLQNIFKQKRIQRAYFRTKNVGLARPFLPFLKSNLLIRLYFKLFNILEQSKLDISTGNKLMTVIQMLLLHCQDLLLFGMFII